MTITSAYANKMLRSLEEEKAFWVNKEATSSTYVVVINEEPVVPEYDYAEVAEGLRIFCNYLKSGDVNHVTRKVFTKRFTFIKNLRVKIIKAIAFFYVFEYTKRNRVARSLLDIGDQAETCAQLFYVKERFYGFEKAIDFR